MTALDQNGYNCFELAIENGHKLVHVHVPISMHMYTYTYMNIYVYTYVRICTADVEFC